MNIAEYKKKVTSLKKAYADAHHEYRKFLNNGEEPKEIESNDFPIMRTVSGDGEPLFTLTSENLGEFTQLKKNIEDARQELMEFIVEHKTFNYD